jgi:hypothetical protein
MAWLDLRKDLAAYFADQDLARNISSNDLLTSSMSAVSARETELAD